MKKRITREQMEFGDLPGDIRPDPSIQRKVDRGETPYSQHPAMPEGEKSFDQIVSSKRFRDVVEKFVRYSGSREPLRGRNAFQSLMMNAMRMMQNITMIEQRNKQYLEQLAVELVVKDMIITPKQFEENKGGIEFNNGVYIAYIIVEDSKGEKRRVNKLQFDAQLVPMGSIRAAEDMQGQAEEFSDEEVKDAFEGNAEELEDFVDSFEKFDMEKAKRRFMNSLIQGAAKKGHYMFELVRSELENVSPQLTNLYGLSMSTLDYLYWLYPEDMVMQMAGSGQGQAGQEEVDLQTDPPTVRAKGSSFPILVHELLKGVYDILGSHGLPDDPRQAEMVKGSEDTLQAEVWDIRLGPIFWEKFLEAFPDELFEDDQKMIRNYLISRFSMLSAEEFLKISKLILDGNPRGTKFIQNLVDGIVKELKQQEYEQTMDDEDEEEGGLATDYDDDDGGDDDDDGLDDLFSGLGITRSK